LEESVPAVALNVILEEFNGIVTLAGAISAGTLELNPTTIGPLVAAALKPTVHVVAPPEDREAGAHAREETVKAGVTRMFPPVADTGTGYPATDAPKVSLTSMYIELAVGASATVTTATLPSGIVFVFNPLVRQVNAAAPPTQLIPLPAAVIAGPGVTENPVTLAAG
jgi:hypothetical protein